MRAPGARGAGRPAPEETRTSRSTCTRGQAAPNQTTKYRLFADSGGFCQLGCGQELFRTDTKAAITIAEFAHVIAASGRGPRGDQEATAEERRSYENIVLLCPTCHTVVDKAPDDYPAEALLERKYAHRAAVRAGVDQRFDTRAEARRRLLKLVRENRVVWEQYGPEGEHRHDPEAPQAAAWRRHALTTIVPNNQAIGELLDANEHLLTEEEKSVAAVFAVHAGEFAARHLEGIAIAGTRFPAELEECFS